MSVLGLQSLLLAAGLPMLAAQQPSLPPSPTWNGPSRELVRPASDPWITPAEAEGFRRTPSYEATVGWLRRLATATPQVRLVSLGKSAEGRDIWMVVASTSGASTPKALRANGRPTLLAQAGIHAGEIDGKDAGLMLLRDLTVARRLDLLRVANFLFVPILNPDGHERVETYGRINQRGPENAGWRTTATNLNLNRDYTKLDTPELRAMIAALRAWDPELYLDLHVTDGGDYQYDLSFGGVGRHGRSPAIAAWLDGPLRTAIVNDLRAAGHLAGPLWIQNLVDPRDPNRGYQDLPSDARFSNGYGDARHIPTLLIENHSLKPYERRVLSNRVFLESSLRALGAQTAAVRAARDQDRARREAEFVLAWGQRSETVAESLLGMSWEAKRSPVTGGTSLAWTGRPVTTQVPVRYADVVAKAVARPRAYWIPPAWQDVIARVELHGIRVERIPQPRDVDVEVCRLENVELARVPFEGRVPLSATCRIERRRERLPTGSVRVTTDQPLGDLAAILLEAGSQDSFLQWGFFHEVLQATEYIEGYIMEPLAERMLDDSALRAAYEDTLARDTALMADPDARLQWLYRRTPWADARQLIYPVFRER
jgi:murein tripeptide amidase MpaA